MRLAVDFIHDLRAQGHEVKLDGEQMLFTAAPGTALEAKRAILDQLRAQKQEILAYLIGGERFSREEFIAECGAPTCAGCYSIGEGKRIHPPKAGYNYDRR